MKFLFNNVSLIFYLLMYYLLNELKLFYSSLLFSLSGRSVFYEFGWISFNLMVIIFIVICLISFRKKYFAKLSILVFVYYTMKNIHFLWFFLQKYPSEMFFISLKSYPLTYLFPILGIVLSLLQLKKLNSLPNLFKLSGWKS